MEITFTASFCSKGAFSPTNSDEEIKWVSRQTWSNQFYAGTSLELNLIWFRITLESYTKTLRAILREDAAVTHMDGGTSK